MMSMGNHLPLLAWGQCCPSGAGLVVVVCLAAQKTAMLLELSFMDRSLVSWIWSLDDILLACPGSGCSGLVPSIDDLQQLS